MRGAESKECQVMQKLQVQSIGLKGCRVDGSQKRDGI